MSVPNAITALQAKENIDKYKMCQTEILQKKLEHVFSIIQQKSLSGETLILIEMDSSNIGRAICAYLKNAPFNYKCSFESHSSYRNEESNQLKIDLS